jgi:hypothetical protein
MVRILYAGSDTYMTPLSSGPMAKKKQTEFLKHLNGFQTNIQFTKEKEGLLPFLGIDTYRKLDDSLGHKVYRRPNHSNFFLHRDSHHHPANNQSWLP